MTPPVPAGRNFRPPGEYRTRSGYGGRKPLPVRRGVRSASRPPSKCAQAVRRGQKATSAGTRGRRPTTSSREGGSDAMILIRRLLGDVLRRKRQDEGLTLRHLAAEAIIL